MISSHGLDDGGAEGSVREHVIVSGRVGVFVVVLAVAGQNGLFVPAPFPLVQKHHVPVPGKAHIAVQMQHVSLIPQHPIAGIECGASPLRVLPRVILVHQARHGVEPFRHGGLVPLTAHRDMHPVRVRRHAPQGQYGILQLRVAA